MSSKDQGQFPPGGFKRHENRNTGCKNLKTALSMEMFSHRSAQQTSYLEANYNRSGNQENPRLFQN
jgi:hypothetical protein